MRDIMIKIGNKIRQRRKLLGLVQPNLSDLSGVNTCTIQLIEQGKGNPSSIDRSPWIKFGTDIKNSHAK
jgi:transcriptional regulator with XRE-family HTH domain